MPDSTGDTAKRLSTYAAKRGIVLTHALGYGIDGQVFSSDRATAVKGLCAASRFNVNSIAMSGYATTASSTFADTACRDSWLGIMSSG